MKKKRGIGYLLFIGVVVVFLQSCSAAKELADREIRPLPKEEIRRGDTSLKDELPTISLETYFADTTLLNLLGKAFKANPDYLTAQQNLLIANAYLKQSKLNFYPTLDYSLNGSATRFGEHTMDGLDMSSNPLLPKSPLPDYWGGLNVSWEIDAWGRIRNYKKSQQFNYFATNEGTQLIRNKIITEVAYQYYQLIALDKKLAIYQENYEIQQKAFEIISIQRETGKSNELAVQQFGAQLDNVLAKIEQINVQIATNIAALSSLTGEYLTSIRRGSNFMENQINILNVEIPLDSVLHNRPDVAKAYFELQGSKADAKVARSAFFPKIQLGGFVGLNSFSIANWLNPSSLAFQILGGLAGPIFNHGKVKMDFYVANRNQEKAFLNYQNQITLAFNELQLLLFEIDKYNTILDIKRNEQSRLEKAVSISNNLYLTGYASYLEIISAQKLKLEAELDIIDYQLLTAEVFIKFYKALGGR